MMLSIDKAFEERSAEGASEDQIENIAIHYRQWKHEQNQADDIYQVSREWLPIYEKYMGEVMDALIGNKILDLKRMYENFFRLPLSTGLHGLHFDMTEKYMNPAVPASNDDLQRYLESSAFSARNFLLSCPGTAIDKLVRPPVGNPYCYFLEGHPVYPCADYHYTFAEKISILLKRIESPIIMEIGGGFGGLAYYCTREIQNLKYICVDLPENCALQAYFLMSHFPSKNIKLYDQSEWNDDFDVLILPSYGIQNIPDNSVNLSFNSYSLAEMGWPTINQYISAICRVTTDFFYHLNHVHWEVSSDIFPIDLAKFQLLFRNPTNWGKDPRKYRLDQHEFLYIHRNSTV